MGLPKVAAAERQQSDRQLSEYFKHLKIFQRIFFFGEKFSKQN
jgi:hypothetical protein